MIVIYDVQLKHRQNAIIRLLKGIQRQQQSRKQSTTNTNDIDLIFLANSNQAHVELEAIRDIIMSDDDSTSIQSIHIIPVYNVKVNNQDELDTYMDSIVHEIHCLNDSSDGDGRIVESPVQIDSFMTLIQSVHFKLSGKNNCVEENRNVCNIIVEEADEDEEEQVTILSADPTTLLEEDGSVIDHNKEDDIEVIDEETEDVLDYREEEVMDEVTKDIPNHPEEHDTSTEMDSVDEYTNSETENDEVMNLDGAHVTSETYVVHSHSHPPIDQIDDEIPSPPPPPFTNIDTSKSSKRVLEDVLVKKINYVTQQAERKMYELEMKQDEVLLKIEKTMPILQFGSEASNILKEVNNSFDDEDVRSYIDDKADSEIVESEL